MLTVSKNAFFSVEMTGMQDTETFFPSLQAVGGRALLQSAGMNAPIGEGKSVAEKR